MPAIKYGLSPEDVAWIEDVLSNDEASSGDELLDYFVRNGLATDQAEAVLKHRSDYLTNIHFSGQGPLREE